MVRTVDQTPYSHVRLRWTNSVGVDIVYEASGTTVKFLGPLAQERLPVVITHSYTFDISKEKYRELVKLCMENAGVSYGFKQILGIGLVKLFNLKKNPLSEGRKSQVCSEVVGRFLQEILNIGHELDLDVASPKDIQEALKERYDYQD